MLLVMECLLNKDRDDHWNITVISSPSIHGQHFVLTATNVSVRQSYGNTFYDEVNNEVRSDRPPPLLINVYWLSREDVTR